MIGSFLVTDPAWYERLSRRPGEQEVNHWRPSPRAVVLDEGTPVFFKLRGRAAVVGCGTFVKWTLLPDWLAWDAFGESNGVPTLEVLRQLVRKQQERASIAPDPQRRIGCRLIAQAHFFPPGEWVAAPSDWKPKTQSEARCDLAVGEGRRVWEECRARIPRDRGEVHDPEGGYGAPRLVAPRIGQGIFRVQVLDAYGRACAVTRERSLPVLEAAHIRPFSDAPVHRVENGLCLRSDLHRLLDRGYVTVDEDFRFVVGDRLRDEFQNGLSYYKLQGTALALPSDARHRPSAEALAWHREHRFVG